MCSARLGTHHGDVLRVGHHGALVLVHALTTAAGDEQSVVRGFAAAPRGPLHLRGNLSPPAISLACRTVAQGMTVRMTRPERARCHRQDTGPVSFISGTDNSLRNTVIPSWPPRVATSITQFILEFWTSDCPAVTHAKLSLSNWVTIYARSPSVNKHLYSILFFRVLWKSESQLRIIGNFNAN